VRRVTTAIIEAVQPALDPASVVHPKLREVAALVQAAR
jgi:hypothetical protein